MAKHINNDYTEESSAKPGYRASRIHADELRSRRRQLRSAAGYQAEMSNTDSLEANRCCGGDRHGGPVSGGAQRGNSGPTCATGWSRSASFSDEELLAVGVDPSMLSDPNYVNAKACARRRTRVFDRALLWFHATRGGDHRSAAASVYGVRVGSVGNCGLRPGKIDGRSVCYAGLSMNTYLLNIYRIAKVLRNRQRASRRSVSGTIRTTSLRRVSYKLDLKGPSVNVQTACSTSLVAVHIGLSEFAQRRMRHGVGGRRVSDFAVEDRFSCIRKVACLA